MPDLAHFHAIVHGRVQGVYYRAFTARAAKSLSLKGYVKNLSRSGDVELEAEGERARLEELLVRLKAGPPDALVIDIDTRWSDFTGQYANFDVRY